MTAALVACSERFELAEAGAVVAPGTRPDAEDSGGADTASDTGDTAVVAPPLELCINEFMPDNAASTQDETLAFPDWIELHNPGDVPVPLDGWTLTDLQQEPDRHVLGGGLAVPAGGFQLLWADALPEVGPDHLSFRLSSVGGEVALFAPDGRGSVVTHGAMPADFSIARVPDCCAGEACFSFEFRGSPGASNVAPVYEPVELVAAGGTWRYWDQGASPGDGWEAPGFDDSAWPAGPGPFGYGDAHQVTSIDYGGIDASKHVTTWFRTTFVAPDAPLASLTLTLLRDDGARVFLNGTEVARDNLPDGPLADGTLASASVGSADETAYWVFDLDPAAVRAGTNTLAVDVHQAAADSSDLGFDLTLEGQRLVPPPGGPSP